MFIWKRVVVLAVVLTRLSAPLAAQIAQTTPSEAERWRALVSQLEPAAVVAVRLTDGSRLKGTVLDAGDASFAVKPHTRIPVAARTIRFDAVESVERTRIGMNPGLKVLIGVGAGVGGFLLLAFAVVANAD